MASNIEWEQVTVGMIILCPVAGRTETVVSVTVVNKHPYEVLVTTDHDSHRRLGSKRVDIRPSHIFELHEL